MKTASTNERMAQVLDAMAGVNCHPICRVYYRDDSGEWWPLDDVLTVGANKSAVDSRYSSFSLVPPAGTASITMSNRGEKYTPGKGGPFDGVLTRNRPLRIEMGFKVDENLHLDSAISLDTIPQEYYHTKLEGGRIVPDIAAPAAPPSIPGVSIDLYGGIKFGESAFSYEGYFLTAPVDLADLSIADLESVKIRAGGPGVSVAFRISYSLADISAKPFSILGESVLGESGEFGIIAGFNRFIQFCFLFHGGTWENSVWVDRVILTHDAGNEFFQVGTYLADDPDFTSSPAGFTASFQVRDYLKKSLETKITIKALSNVDISIIIRKAAAKCGIPYTDASIPLTGTIVSIPSSKPISNESAQLVFAECLDFLFANDTNSINWRLFISDSGLLTLAEKPVSAELPDFALEYKTDLFSLSKKYTSNSLLQRATVFDFDSTVQEEDDAIDYTATGTGNETPADAAGVHWSDNKHVVLSWVSARVYKNLEVYYNDSGAGVSVQIVDADLYSMTIKIERGAAEWFNVRLLVTGCRFSGTPGKSGEYFASANHVITRAIQGVGGTDQARDGLTYKWTNRFISSNAQAAALAKKMVSEYGNKRFQLSVTHWGAPFLEIGDKIMVHEKYTNTLSIFVVEAISHSFTAEGAKFRTSLTLSDIGATLENFVYDRAGISEGVEDLSHDIGLLYDQDVDGETDPTDWEAPANVGQLAF